MPPAQVAPSTTDNGASRNTSESIGIARLIDVGATTCAPCKMMARVLEELGRDYKRNLEVVFIDVTKDRSAATRYKVRVIPTQVFYDRSGREFFRHMGFYSEDDILAKFKEHRIDLEKGSKHD